jgi:PAS domain S-box-containing protein
MLGYECEEDLLGINIAELYFDRKNEIEFREMLIRDKKVTNSKVKLKKKNNEAIYVSVNSFVIEDANGKYDGREGTITDVTNEEYFRRILEDTPIGLYELKLDGEKDVITRCNRQFQDLFEFNEGESAIDFNSRDSTDYVGGKYNEMIQKLIELDKEGQKPLRNFYLPIITRRGNKKTIEVNTRFEHDAEGKIIGRIGGLVDVTDEVKFRERVRELTVDIGSVLHAYSSTLVMLGLTIEFIIEALGPDPMKDLKNMSPEQEMEIIREPANALLTSLQRMIYSFTPDNRRTDVYTRLFHLADILKSLNTEIPNLEFRLPTVEEIAQEIASLCNTIDGPELVEKAKNEVLSFNEELLRLCNLIELHRADKEIIAMGHQVSTLREYVLYDTRTKEPRTFVKIRSLIGQAVNKMDRYLKYEKMDVKFKIDNGDTEVPVVERDIIRAIGNLLHNAIKYSWQRAEQLNRWITVASQVEGGFLVIEIEDYGLAVPRDEIENDILFKIGSRGRQSIDRGRVGTGVGLADARRVARDHGGDVTLKSHPFKQHGNPNDYSQPFITTAIIKLPLMEIFQ